MPQHEKLCWQTLHGDPRWTNREKIGHIRLLVLCAAWLLAKRCLKCQTGSACAVVLLMGLHLGEGGGQASRQLYGNESVILVEGLGSFFNGFMQIATNC